MQRTNTHTRLDHPAAWVGSQLQESRLWGTKFSPGWISDDGELSPPCNEILVDIQNELEYGCGAVLLKGFPVGDYGGTTLAEHFLKMVSVVGTPISQSASGDQVFSVRNEGYAESDPRARGPNTKKKLSFHTDRCDVIAFLCIKQAKTGGENQIVSSMSIFNHLLDNRPELLEVLRQPFYYQRHNVDIGNAQPFTLQPIFSFCQGHFASNFLRVLIERAYQSPDVPAMTDLQREALDYLEATASNPNLHTTFRQEPGDILLLNNWVNYHRRTEFVDYEEIHKRRHLLRVWLSVPNSRPLDPMFSGNYGATSAGSIRGGMHSAAN